MLRRIELRGFKSFAGSTALEFGPGLNVIVGPNGSGKSNLAEAIVWAMGEQRAARLRAGGMGEVVFSGGASRPAAGVAEVRMTLADEHPAGDIGRPAEVEVWRRVTRAGDAGYRLNGASCRLLDVHEALALRGLGPDALAVIRQGQVEAVCTARPADLRAILEEAAGVALSRRRRRRAEARLSRVGERLDRARDLAGELAARRATLERQATAAARAVELEDLIERARDRAHEAAAHAAAAVLAGAEERRRSAVEARDACTAAAAAAAERAERAEEAAAALRGRRARTEAVLAAVRSARDRLADRREFAEERVREAGDRARRIRERATRAAAERTELQRRLAEARGRTAAAQAALDAADGAREAARREHERHIATARDTRERADAARAELTAVRARLTAERERTAQASRELEAARRALVGLGGDPGEAESLERAQRRAEVARERASRCAVRAQDAQAVVDDAEAAVRAAAERRREADAEAARLRPARAAAAAGLGAGISVAPGAEEAVGAALGDLAEAVLVADVPEAVSAVHDGATTAVVPAPARSAAAPPPGTRPLIELVQACPDHVRPHLERLLAECWLVDDLTLVPAGHGGLFVTPAGDVLRPAGGVVTRVRGDWARAARHRAAAERVAALAADLGEAEAVRGAARTAAERMRRRRRAAEAGAARAERVLAERRSRVEARARVLADARVRLERAESQMAALTHSEGDPDAVLAEHAARSERAAADAQGATEAAEAAARALRDADRAASAARAEHAAAEVALARLAEADRALAGQAVAPEPRDTAPARAAVAALADVCSALTERAAGLQGSLDAAAGPLRQARDAAARARDDVAAAQAAERQAVGVAHNAELALAAARARADEVGPPRGEDPGPVDADALAREVAELERRRRALGAVNPLAAAERDEVDARITEIEEQIADLEEAAEAIHAHMTGLDSAVSEGFDEVFRAVEARFHEVVASLFPGGSGRLAVVGDAEDPGVEIQVVPAGKRPRSLSLMSGGERSLVALAFCLAIAMARPAPFYLLDEVEAALDDTNLRRLLALVRRLSHQTQFVMITHQQPTVEIADTLFGVSMASDGVSQVVARRLDQGLEGSARPFVRRQLTAIRGGRA